MIRLAFDVQYESSGHSTREIHTRLIYALHGVVSIFVGSELLELCEDTDGQAASITIVDRRSQ